MKYRSTGCRRRFDVLTDTVPTLETPTRTACLVPIFSARFRLRRHLAGKMELRLVALSRLVSLMTCRVYSYKHFDQRVVLVSANQPRHVVLVPRPRPRGCHWVGVPPGDMDGGRAAAYLSPVSHGGEILREAPSGVEGPISLVVRRPSPMRQIERAGWVGSRGGLGPNKEQSTPYL